MSLSPYIHAIGRGPSRGRSLTQAEAADAMSQILAGTAAPEAVGALLMLMRYRGETAAEIAGFTQAARRSLGEWQGIGATLDWPSYAAGRSRGLPWFLISAQLMARSGQRVLLQGWNSHQKEILDVRKGARALGIPIATDHVHARTVLAEQGIVYAPLEVVSPALLKTLKLRQTLGLRSAANTLCRMLNPGRAETAVQGVFHPSYKGLQQDAGRLLGQARLMVIKGGGGEFERHPAKACTALGLAAGVPSQITHPAILGEHRRLADGAYTRSMLSDFWSGDIWDPWAEAIVIGTTALALIAVEPDLAHDHALQRAQALWHQRHRRIAA